ncbi:MAG: anaerobic ribonucleoside-triphosphate reductase activating protein [Chlorobi bacterium]|nr:anaerobic ribonucleoside-triphosphate reductase activating protein [Chlorobiota bacterium]
MKIAGFKKQSLIDYPGHISSVIFTQGCNFRCGFCHNPDLVLPEKFGHTYREEEIFTYLKKYELILDAVCITGGEPTIHKDLPVFIQKIINLGLKIKLDSNGTNPEMLKHLISNNLIDFIAMDIKHILDLGKYNEATGNVINRKTFEKIKLSIEIIKSSGIEYEFRTTVMKGLHTIDDITSLKNTFKSNYRIQNFNPEVVLDTNTNYSAFSQEEIDALLIG